MLGLASLFISVACGWITPFAVGIRRDGSGDIVFDLAITHPRANPVAMRDRQAEMLDASVQMLQANANMRWALGNFDGVA